MAITNDPYSQVYQNLPGTPPGDPSADLVQELLSKLALPQAPEPPKTSVGGQVLGGLGDALTAAASVLAGGTPGRGAFATRQQQLQDQYHDDLMASESEKRNVENRIRIGAFEEERRIRVARGEEERKRKIQLEDDRREMDERLRQKLIGTAVDIGVPVSADMGTNEILAAINEQDPALATQDILSNIKDGYEAYNLQYTTDKRGRTRISSANVRLKKPGGDGVSSSGVLDSAELKQAQMLGEGGIFNGGDVLYPDDPMKAKGFNIFSRQHFDKRNSQEAVKSITDIRDALRDGSARVFSDSPGLDTTLTETLTELSPLVATMNLDKIHELWVDEVTAARNLISNGQITPAQADKYLEFIRKNIEVGFPGLNLGLPAPDSTPEPTPDEDVSGGSDSGGSQIIRAVHGIMSVAQKPDDSLSVEDRDARVRFNRLSPEEKKAVESLAEGKNISIEEAMKLVEKSLTVGK